MDQQVSINSIVDVVCSGVEIRGVHATFALVHARFDCHQRFISWISGILDVFMAQVGCLETSLKPPSSLHYIKVVFPDQKEQQISVDSFMGLLKLKRHFVFLKWRVYCWSKCSVLVILDRILNWWNPMKVRFKWKDVTINNLSKEYFEFPMSAIDPLLLNYVPGTQKIWPCFSSTLNVAVSENQ